MLKPKFTDLNLCRYNGSCVNLQFSLDKNENLCLCIFPFKTISTGFVSVLEFPNQKLFGTNKSIEVFIENLYLNKLKFRA